VHRFPRWLFVVTWTAGIVLAHAVAPWALALLGDRHGWSASRPAAVNLGGLVLVAVGGGVLAWIGAMIMSGAPSGWQFARFRDPSTWSPQSLFVGGPYQYSRNPMYVAELTMWAGWSLFFGSIAVGAATLLFWTAIAYGQIPREERALVARMDRRYVEYRNRVPRWLGRIRP